MSRRSPTRGSSGCSSRSPPPPRRGRRADERGALLAALVAREADDATAIAVGGGVSLSFAALADRVASIAEGLRDAGVAPGDRVALLAPDPPDFIAAAYACWAIGAVAVVVDRGLGFKGLRRALRSAEPRWLVGTRKTLGAARALRWAPDARPLELASLSGSGAKLSDVVERHAPGADALAAVVFTSGATGPAKGVLYDQRTMAAQYTAVRECYAIGADDRLVAAFAPFALYGPALGIPVAVPDCDITKPASLRAEALADACAAVDATIVFAAPAALDGVLASQETLTAEGREALAALRLVLSAGAPVPQRTLEAFSLLAPAAELHTPYGMTEVLSVADIDLETLARVGPGRGVCVGLPLAGVGLRIEPLPGRRRRVRRDRRQRAVAVARLRRALGDERSRPDRRRARGGVASHGRRRAPRRRRAALGRGAARARRRDGRRPGDAGAARDRGHGGNRPALRGDGSRPGRHASRSSWSSRTRARRASPRPPSIRPSARRSQTGRSPPCSPFLTSRSTSATTRRSTARGSAAGRARCSRAARHRGVSDAGPRHGRLGPARAPDDRRARGARARRRGAPAPPERRARVRAGPRRRPRRGRRRGRRGRVRRGRPRCREGRRRRHARGVPRRQRRWHRGGRRGLPGCRRAATRRRLLAVGRLRVDADRGCGSGDADHASAAIAPGTRSRRPRPSSSRWRRTTARSR